MNLASTIRLLAGGPGSGCKGSNCGRPIGGSVRWKTGYVSKFLKSKFIDVHVDDIRRNPTNGRLNAEIVGKYAEQMRSGKTIVAPQGYAIGNGKYELNDGHHRFAAAKKIGEKIVKLQVVR